MSQEKANDNILKLSGIHKKFPGVHALKGVDFDLKRGEVRGLVGENGAGKSTLMNVLGGVIHPDSGEISIAGENVLIESPNKAEKVGISFIHQELSIFNNLNVASNVFIHNLPKTGPFIKKKELFSCTREHLLRVGLGHINPGQLVKHLRMGQRQLVEIAQCLTQSPKILILDEPTSSLTKSEIDQLFDIITSLKQEGVSIVFISHRLNEIYRVCDSITVMRDGMSIETKKILDITQSEVVRLMIGREIKELYTHIPKIPGKTLLKVKGLTHEPHFSNISFELKEREIVGLYGLMGSGRTEIVRAIFGLDSFDDGEVEIEGDGKPIKSPRHAIQKGLALITENRREEGLDIKHSVQSNLLLASLKKYIKAISFMDFDKEKTTAIENIQALNIKTSSPAKIVRFLSGGNQQKVVIAKWLNTNPKILMLDEPTRGIDVGAKKEVFTILDDLLDNNVGIFLISSELSELTGTCDRILVICNGSIVAEVTNNDMTEEGILSYAMGAN